MCISKCVHNDFAQFEHVMTDLLTNVKSPFFSAKFFLFTQVTDEQHVLGGAEIYISQNSMLLVGFFLDPVCIVYSSCQDNPLFRSSRSIIQQKPAQACLFTLWDSTCMKGLALTGWATTKRRRKKPGFQVDWACWDTKNLKTGCVNKTLVILTLSCVCP